MKRSKFFDVPRSFAREDCTKEQARIAHKLKNVHVGVEVGQFSQGFLIAWSEVTNNATVRDIFERELERRRQLEAP